MKLKIYNIETTNICNAKCSYCPHSKMTRAQGFMSVPDFRQTLNIMENKYVALHNFGEPLLDKILPHFIYLAKEKGIKVEFSTNGSYKEKIDAVMQEEPYLIRYAYDAFEDLTFLKALTDRNKSTIIISHSVNEGTKPITNFAGSVENESAVVGECYFKKYNYVTVLWDGRIVPCCCDYDGTEVLGTIWDERIELHEDYKLCERCKGLQFADHGLWEAN